MPKKEVTPEIQEKEPSKEITIELDEKNQPIPAEKKEEPKYVTPEILTATLTEAIKKATAPLYYEMRKMPRETQQVQREEPVIKTENIDEWDKKLQSDWKGTVRELARLEAQEIRKQEQVQYQANAERMKNAQLLEANKQAVINRHKELDDENHIKNQLYRQVIQEKPEYLTNSYGPILAMRDMEDKLKEMGYIDEPTKHQVEREVLRQTRTNGAILPKGMPPSNKNSVTLTKDQKEFCDLNNIKYENYARFSKQATQGGVEA